jgi:hypothetical protein
LAEWDEVKPKGVLIMPEDKLPEGGVDEVRKEWEKYSKMYGVVFSKHDAIYTLIKSGLPKLPANISPVPMDLNDMIAHKKGISISEAFDLNREFLAGAMIGSAAGHKHNSFWDAKVIKAIYEKLK